MQLTVKPTKSKIIYETIEKQILEGKLKAGERIQSIRDVAARFSTSISVVQSVLRQLSDNNLIEKRPGDGTYVKATKFKSMSKNVLLSLPDEGHIYGKLNSAIKRELIAKGYIPISVDYSQAISMEPDSAFKKNMDEILRSDLKGTIILGDHYWRQPFLERHPNLRAVFLSNIDYSGETPERGAFLNYEKSLYITTAHLAKNGRKKIMLCTFKPDPRSLSSETFTRHHSSQIISGYERALREYNIASYHKIFYRTDVDINEDALYEILDSGERPDSIVCDMDYSAMLFINSAIKLGIKVPEELSLTGTFNTPWAELSPIKITSTSFDWEKLAVESVRLAIEDNPKKKIVYMNPSLLVRESSSAKK